ncbi:MAG: hypothetical protein ACXWU5_04230 [Rhodoplanes sp.]
MPSQLPLSLQWFQVLAPTAIAFIALVVTAWIQIGQSRTTRTKLKLDLFNERFDVFKVIEELNRAAIEARGDNWAGEYISKMKEAMGRMLRFRLLFPNQIGSQVDEIVEHWHDFVTLKAEGEGIDKPSPQWSDNQKRRRKVWEIIDEKNNRLRKNIEDFIRVDWNG